MTDTQAVATNDKQPIHVPRVEDSAIVITGGTSGVGLASAQRFLGHGAKRLALLGRDERRGHAAVETVRTGDPDAQVEFVRVDAADPAQAARAVERVVSLLGSIDVLVNSTTGSAVPALLHNTPIEDMASIITQQALGPLHMTRAALPQMRKQRGGVIINIASDAAKVATPGESVIGAAMAAIVMFSRTAAMEAKRDGIRVNVLTPSLIRGTPTGERVLEGGFSAKLFTKAIGLAHLGVPEPDDLAGLIVFLAGPDAALLTGQAISLNGGISAA
jgi:NAD(P)-dependent dehydrogenase (short-subunit alcohol dehydrogenase family)